MANLTIFVDFVDKNYKVPYNLVDCGNVSLTDSVSAEPKAMGFGAVTGILISFLVHVFVSYEYKTRGTLNTFLSKIVNRKNISRTIALVVIVLILPALIGLLLLASVYKVLCATIIKRNDKKFVGFLDSFDVFWSLEDTSKSIINVLGVIESDTPQAIASNIKRKLEKVLSDDGTGKIFFRRNEKYGFYYWRRHSSVDMDQYVEVIEFANKNEDDIVNVSDLENLMTDLQETTLPYKDEGLFKILITRQRVGNHDNERGEYGIIFRIHHSVGDGVALIEFLCRTLADKTDDCPVNLFSMPEVYTKPRSPRDLIDMMRTLLEIPICVVDGILRKPDESPLHGVTLTGKNVFKWTESDENLLTMVKEIKENVDGTYFSEVLVTALSKGLWDFFQETEGKTPEDVAVILPIRFPKTSIGDPILKNDFSVTILDVPMKGKDNLNEVKNRCKLLRKSADPLTNYYFLKLVCSVLSKNILQPMLYSRQATMVLSNLPGPARLSICGGNVLQSLVFFLPHKGTTGLGVTALCYGGVLRLAVSADQALIPEAEHLTPILKGMVEEIRRMHAKYVKKSTC